MGRMAILDTVGQKSAVTMLMARIVCRQEDGPCKTCMEYCAQWVTPHAFPAIKHAMMTAIRSGELAEGFGALMVGAIMAGPNTSPRTEEEQRGS